MMSKGGEIAFFMNTGNRVLDLVSAMYKLHACYVLQGIEVGSNYDRHLNMQLRIQSRNPSQPFAFIIMRRAKACMLSLCY